MEYGRGKDGASTAPRRRPQKPSHARRRAASRRRERALRSALPAPARDARRARARALSHLSTQTLHGRCVAAVSRHNHRAAARRSARAAVSRARLSPAAQAKTNSVLKGKLERLPSLYPSCHAAAAALVSPLSLRRGRGRTEVPRAVRVILRFAPSGSIYCDCRAADECGLKKRVLPRAPRAAAALVCSFFCLFVVVYRLEM